MKGYNHVKDLIYLHERKVLRSLIHVASIYANLLEQKKAFA